MTKGGFSIIPFSQSRFGGANSIVEPRFLSSRPVDRSRNVPLDTILRFETYCYDSWIDIPDVVINISEDGGDTYNTAFDGVVGFHSPFDGEYSKYRRSGGHSLVFYIHKTSDWPIPSRIMIQFIGPDNFGQEATKNTPVVW